MFSHKMLENHIFPEFEELTDALVHKVDAFAETGGLLLLNQNFLTIDLFVSFGSRRVI
jgi:hypothetical protein